MPHDPEILLLGIVMQSVYTQLVREVNKVMFIMKAVIARIRVYKFLASNNSIYNFKDL